MNLTETLKSIQCALENLQQHTTKEVRLTTAHILNLFESNELSSLQRTKIKEELEDLESALVMFMEGMKLAYTIGTLE